MVEEAELMLTPLDIHNQEFKRSFRGYNEDEIDTFLDRVIKDYEQLYRDNVQLKEKANQMQDDIGRFKQMEATLHETLVIAQKTAEEVKVNAQKEAANIVAEAQLNAKKLMIEAAEKVHQQSVSYQDMQRQYDSFQTKMKTLLVTQLNLLDLTDQSTTDKTVPEQDVNLPNNEVPLD